VKPTHVLLSGAPGLAREIVAQIVSSQGDMTLIATTEAISPGVDAEHGDDVDVIVMLLDERSPSHDAAVLRAFPACTAVVVGNGGAGAWTYGYEVRRIDEIVGDLTPDAVAGAIRSAAKRTAQARSISPGP
jgi:hypothetical protein